MQNAVVKKQMSDQAKVEGCDRGVDKTAKLLAPKKKDLPPSNFFADNCNAYDKVRAAQLICCY